ncbi:MAG: hypothetical protein ACFCD0_24875 [Gemmataceae bacterium]
MSSTSTVVPQAIPVETTGLACYPESELSMACMLNMSWCELDQLYQTGKVPQIPCGYCKGKVLIQRKRLFSEIETRIARSMWRGKHFDCCTGMAINQWPLRKALTSKFYYGCSMVDGRKTLFVDYTQTSFRWRNVKDEIREVAPGLLLGRYFVRTNGCWQQKLFFAMETPRGDPCCRNE